MLKLPPLIHCEQNIVSIVQLKEEGYYYEGTEWNNNIQTHSSLFSHFIFHYYCHKS